MNAETPWLTLDPDAPIDLQLHTTFSDGRWGLADLLDHVATEGFALVAVTDHDSPWTAAEVRWQGAARGVATVPAVEMSSTWEGQFLDLLCFGFDPADSGALGAIAADTRRRQLDNLRETYATLYAQRAGIEGARSQGVRAFGLRQARSRGLRKTHLQDVATATAMNLSRLHHWFEGDLPTTTRRSRFARVAVA
jgi:predicted metal-dependent phosphoesterase TrpH